MNTPPSSPKQEFSTPFAPIKSKESKEFKDVDDVEKNEDVQRKSVVRELFPQHTDEKKGAKRELFKPINVPKFEF